MVVHTDKSMKLYFVRVEGLSAEDAAILGTLINRQGFSVYFGKRRKVK